MQVTDKNEMKASGRFLIKVIENESEGIQFIREAIVTPTDCNAREGSIQLDMIGDVADCTFTWSNGQVELSSSSPYVQFEPSVLEIGSMNAFDTLDTMSVKVVAFCCTTC